MCIVSAVIIALIIIILIHYLVSESRSTEKYENGTGGAFGNNIAPVSGGSQPWLLNEWDSYKFGQTQDQYLNYWQGYNNNELYLPDCVTCSDEICRGVRKPGSFCINTSGPMKGITQRCPSR